MWKIPLSDVDIGEREIEAVTAVLRSKWLTMGEVTRRFERAFAERLGVKHAFAVANCTAAPLEIAYRLSGIEPGDEVIMPSLTFVATANATVALGGVPRFCDIGGEGDLNASVADIERKITPRTRAIGVVHFAGFACDMAPLVELARARRLLLVEDCAHAPGATYRGTSLGAIGDVGCFSFFSNKNLTTGEGGMITTQRDDLAERIRLLRSHGMTTLTLDRHKGHAFTYDVVEAGYNFRIDELRSAIGLVQLDKLDAGNARRAELAARYRRGLDGVDGIRLPFAGRAEGSSHHIQSAVLAPGNDREQFMTRMREAGIQTSIHYPAIHRFSYYQQRFPDEAAGLPETESIRLRIVTLPLHPGMRDEDVDYVTSTVRSLVKS